MKRRRGENEKLTFDLGSGGNRLLLFGKQPVGKKCKKSYLREKTGKKENRPLGPYLCVPPH